MSWRFRSFPVVGSCEIIFQMAILHSETEAEPAFTSSNFSLLPFTSSALDVPAMLAVEKGQMTFLLAVRGQLGDNVDNCETGLAESYGADDYIQLADGPRKFGL